LSLAWSKAEGLIHSRFQEIVEGKIKDPISEKLEWTDVKPEDENYLRGTEKQSLRLQASASSIVYLNFIFLF
jgi:hypothetical protein